MLRAPSRYFFGEIDHRCPSVIGVDHGLQRDHDREQCGRRHLHVCAGRAYGRPEKARDDDRHEGAHFEKAGDLLRSAAPRDAAPLQQCEEDRHADRDRGHSATERRKQSSRVFADDDRHGGRGATRRDPVTPPDDESRVVAECPSRKHVLTARCRQQRSELRNAERTEQRVQAAQNPDAEEQKRGG